MDNAIDIAPNEYTPELSYDDTVAYEEQVPTEEERVASLANRIGRTKVYLLSETTSQARIGKRKHGEDSEVSVEDEIEIDQDQVHRSNALLLHGSPVADLPTARIFAYATHFDAHPIALEWVDDHTCVLVFESSSAARTGFSHLQKVDAEEPDEDGETAQPHLGQGEGLKGIIKMRWARTDDVKKRGAKQESEFYRKHGADAGKELINGRDLPLAKRRRREEDPIDEAAQRAKLDSELDEFLAQEDEEDAVPPSPPSKMRSDYIADDGRTLLERTSSIRFHPDVSDPIPDLASRLHAPLPRRARGGRGQREYSPESGKLDWGRSNSRNNDRDVRRRGGRGERNGRNTRGEKRNERPKKTQEELDAELDAFLNSND
ncbi:hypothetical protein BDQ17DRAFT_1390226 [Cyathus striatus]|nr:hypothetical protein BDQ17DRAFT_1390226 [Cyathus striatus]